MNYIHYNIIKYWEYFISNKNWSKDLLIETFFIFGLFCAFTASAQSTEFDDEVRPETFYDNEFMCRGEWKYPSDCSNFTCDYKASWEYLDDDDQIIFTISTKNRNKWTGIGFSDNQAMPETDTILGLVEERYFPPH